MAFRTRSSSNSRSVRKGQFFVLTTVAVVTVLFFMSRWIDPLAQSDASDIAKMEELFTFDNIVEKTSAVVKNSEDCYNLEQNLQEYKSFISDFARDKNYKISFTYILSPSCEELGAAIAEFTMGIISDKVDAGSVFSITWP